MSKNKLKKMRAQCLRLQSLLRTLRSEAIVALKLGEIDPAFKLLDMAVELLDTAVDQYEYRIEVETRVAA